ncbi:hypothetical protein [Methylobacterium sp. R2-1]|uniref:hypothetical protein n=1 Tax=Methylobacterium sp. R2-1 TaxID=2587064 RepID=UPI00161D5FB1|nr:hypothetical protein [Methylobacterium sp. R2-1]MBB2961411.1 hypothetical protein [Methylobacterium sp. R2-1]
MKRPRTTGHLAAPAPASVVPAPQPRHGDAVDSAVMALLSLIAAVETQPAGPATKAYRAAIRRKGEEAAAAGGSEVLEDVLRQVCDAAPDRAERRGRILTEAWVDLIGEKP